MQSVRQSRLLFCLALHFLRRANTVIFKTCPRCWASSEQSDHITRARGKPLDDGIGNTFVLVNQDHSP